MQQMRSHAPMNDFVRRLPWRLGALGGLVVGAISLTGEVELWTCLVRTGIAFVVFAILGFGLRALLEAGMGIPPSDSQPRQETGTRRPETGAHIDQTTPPMTAGDLPPEDRSHGDH